MQQKKNSLIELFYIALLLTASRPPDQLSLLSSRSRLFNFGENSSNGPVIVDNYFYDDIRSVHLNGRSHDRYFGTKSSILLQETLDVLADLNSLGRYSQQQHSSNLIAFPGLVSNFANDGEQKDEQSEVANEPNENIPVEDPFPYFDDYSFDIWENLNEDPLIQADDSLFDQKPSESTTSQQQEENGEPTQDLSEDEAITTNTIDDFLLDDSVMLPILDTGNGDVDDLFGELEFLLSNETDSYGQEWQNIYPTIPTTNENGPEYPIYDSTQNCNLYENTPNVQMVNNSSAQYSQNNNFGAVLYSSLTTLSNGQDHLNQDLSSTNLVYTNGNDTVSYLNNVVPYNSNSNNASSTDCFYNGYMEEFNPLSNFTDINQSQNFEYHQLDTSTMASTNTPVNKNAKFSGNNEECFDKSSDSAVSSMSSDRVQSLSDDLGETSSESSYNCDGNLPGGHALDKCNAAAQKKYCYFGKNKTQEPIKEEYYSDYSHVNYTIYSNSAYAVDPNENYNQINYYTVANENVQHNHTYAQMPPNEPLNSVSCSNVSQDWNHQDSSIKDECKSEVSFSSKVHNEKPRENHEGRDRDHHFNRDEKRARALNLPISTHDIINLPIDEFNERLTKYELTENQLSLIRDIRRRGKNKVAAQNCRKRKLDQIMGLQSEVDTMYSQKDLLQNEYNRLFMLREMARDKYAKLYQFVVEASSSRQPFFDLTSSPPDFPVKDSSSSGIQMNDKSHNGFIISGNMTSSPLPVHSCCGIGSEFGGEQK